MKHTALTIAGSDPGGGAGIQRDLRTFAAGDVAGLSVVTAITVQTSTGVESIHPVEAGILESQLNAILSDTNPNAVKIGMLSDVDQVKAISAGLRRHRPENIVLDPVISSAGGVSFLGPQAQQTLLQELMPLCTLITPNLNEAAALTGQDVHDQESAIAAGRQLLSMGANAVLVKGGHASGEPEDVLLYPEGRIVRYPGIRVPTPHTHGTGCLLSSAIAAGLASGRTLEGAILDAKALVSASLRNPQILGKGRGYPEPPGRSTSSIDDRSHNDRLRRFHGLYVLTDPNIRPDRSPEEVVKAALKGGAQIIQLRHKALDTPQLIDLARRLCSMVHAADKLFIVNDRVDVALAADADGVHLGPDDMHPADARRLLGPNKLIGVSTGTLNEAIEAAQYASYFGVGAIYGSSTKLDAGAPVGCDRISEIKSAFPSIPIVAIGGINLHNIGDVFRSGADAAAVVSAVLKAEDMVRVVRELVSVCE